MAAGVEAVEAGEDVDAVEEVLSVGLEKEGLSRLPPKLLEPVVEP